MSRLALFRALGERAPLLVLAVLLAGCGGAPPSPPAARRAPPASRASERLYREGQKHLLEGDTRKALELFRSALAKAEQRGDREGVAASLHGISYVYIKRGQWRRALKYAERVLRQDREILKEIRKSGQTRRAAYQERKVASDLNDLARLYLRLKEPKAALARFRELLALDRRQGRKRGAAITRNNIGRLLFALDDLEGAKRHFHAALRTFEELKDAKMAETVRRNLALLGAIERGRKERRR